MAVTMSLTLWSRSTISTERILFLRIMVMSLTYPILRQSLQHSTSIRSIETIHPSFDSLKHLHLNSAVPIEKCWMTEDTHDIVDDLVGINGWIRPRTDDLCDCVSDNDNGNLTSWIIKPATEMISCQLRIDAKIPFDSIECVGSDAFGLSKTSYCTFSEITRSAPALKFFVTNWTIGLMNGSIRLRTQIVKESVIFSTRASSPGIYNISQTIKI